MVRGETGREAALESAGDKYRVAVKKIKELRGGLEYDIELYQRQLEEEIREIQEMQEGPERGSSADLGRLQRLQGDTARIKEVLNLYQGRLEKINAALSALLAGDKEPAVDLYEEILRERISKLHELIDETKGRWGGSLQGQAVGVETISKILLELSDEPGWR